MVACHPRAGPVRGWLSLEFSYIPTRIGAGRDSFKKAETMIIMWRHHRAILIDVMCT